MKQIICDEIACKIVPDKIIAGWKETKYIVVSSSFFMVPAIYGFYNNLYFLPGVLLFTTLFSVNYWRRATYSWRRIADKTFAKISFVIFCMYGFANVSRTVDVISIYSGLICLIYCYYMSLKSYNNNDINSSNTLIWWKYHLMFHIFVAYNQYVIINSIVTKY
jgi:hypothetical protein